MKTNKILFLLFIISLSILTACGNGSKSVEKTKLKLSFVANDEHGAAIALRNNLGKLNEMTNGEIDLEIYTNGVLYGNEREALEAVQLDNLDITIVTTATLSSFSPNFKVFDLPYLFNDYNEADEHLDGNLGTKVAQDLEKIKMRSLGFQENGFRHIANSRNVVKKPEDVQGLKLRTLASPVYQEMFDILGANASPLSFGELYSALQQGTYDAIEIPVELLYDNKFYEVQKYLSLTSQVYAPVITVINKNTFDQLSTSNQEKLVEWMDIVNKEQREFSRKKELEIIETIKTEKLIDITELSAQEKSVFKEKLKVLYDYFKGEIDDELLEEAKEIFGY